MNYILNCDTMQNLYFNIDSLAEQGQLDLIIELCANTDLITCTKKAIDSAAKNGHYSVVKYLYYNRDEWCTSWAIDRASEHGHLLIVKFLHKHGGDSTTYSMDTAAKNGHFHIVKWLHKHRNEGCTSDAIIMTMINNHFEIFMWLCKHRKEHHYINVVFIATKVYGKFKFANWYRKNILAYSN